MRQQLTFRVATQHLVMLLIAVLVVSRLDRVNATRTPASTMSSQPGRQAHDPLFGLNFGPYKNGEDPDVGAVITEPHLRELLQIVAPYTVWVRTFGSSHGLERVGEVTHSLGLKTALGAWLSADVTANEQELTHLIAAARQGYADMVIVGSEVLLRGDLSEARLIAYIRRVQQALPGIPVSTADVYHVLLSRPAVLAAVDVVLANVYPFWEGIELPRAVPQLHRSYERLKAAAGGKEVMISETGWPTCGQPVGSAVPSVHNASVYFWRFVSWAREHDAAFFYFESFDEPWKTKYEGLRGACWGIWNTAEVMKPGMQRVFDGEIFPGN